MNRIDHPPTGTPRVTLANVLGVLPKARLSEVARSLEVWIPPEATKAAQMAAVIAIHADLEALLPKLTRDELRAVCRAHAVDHKGRSRAELMQRLGITFKAPEPDEDAELLRALGLPSPGQIAVVRHRQHLVTDVQPGEPGQQSLVKLTCLDDDAAGRELEVLWERELGARVIEPEEKGLGQVDRLDEPRHFAAYLHALTWSSVTSTDGRLFQAPFRAGIKLMRHQLVPLMKALELPRANLFIADDVGLGKTIEAGLVMQELLLRQRVDQILIVAPASVCLQWQGEMEKRFGLRFEIYNRAFVGRRRQERGFGVNAWATYPRFIISYQTLRRPEYRDLLLAHLREQAQVGDRARKSLLVVDEAHHAAPASATRYAVDSDTTNVIRDVAQVFEHRLFLSATPHNGHSNSFSALLEILDPQRFTRGVPVKHRDVLDEVMVRRLKRDIKALEHSGEYPDRHVIQIDLAAASPDAGRTAWTARYGEDDRALATHDLGEAGAADLQLSELLRQYAEVANVKGKRGRLALVNLQKRLLSSIEAFARTLVKHAQAVAPDLAVDHGPRDDDATAGALTEEYGSEDDSEDEDDRADNAAVGAPGTARDLLARMIRLAHQHRDAPSPKVLALLDWIRRNQCPGVALGGVARSAPVSHRAWTDTRLIVFTEYAHTKRHLRRLLAAAIDGTAQADARIMDFHGGMSDEQREEVQRAFNGPPDQYPVRILLCTDAAREGVNLQGHCANLFHFDVPWNPGRLEQRNGRIDRTLQPFPDVYCHYFVYPQRVEDRVLQVLVRKVDRIHRELGSLGTVIAEQLARALDDGIRADTAGKLDAAESLGGRVEEFIQVAADDLAGFAEEARHRADVEASSEILNRSRDVAGFSVEHLRDAIDVGLELAGASRLAPAGDGRYTLPAMPPGWERTLDTLRPARRADQDFWEWRDQPPLPVVFEPPDRMTSDVVHLHLHHPFVQRILSRFLAQGFAASDLSRVTVVVNDQDALTRVIAFGRLTLFGHGAARLHEELIGVSARWTEGGGGLRPFAEEADRKALERLERLLERSPTLTVSPSARRTLCEAAPRDFAALWRHVHDEKDARQQLAEQRLAARGAREAEQMRRILERQRAAIHEKMTSKTQLDLFTASGTKPLDPRERKQLEDDLAYMQRRFDEMSIELEREPARIQESYRVVRARLEPVGLVYLWPASR